MTKEGIGPAQVNRQEGGAPLFAGDVPQKERSVCAANDEQSGPQLDFIIA